MPLDQTRLRIPFDTAYARLPARFYARVEPTHVAAPGIVRVNGDIAAVSEAGCPEESVAVREPCVPAWCEN